MFDYVVTWEWFLVHKMHINGWTTQNDVSSTKNAYQRASLLSYPNYEKSIYRQSSSISLTLVGNKLDAHSDVVGASPVGAAPTKSSFST